MQSPLITPKPKIILGVCSSIAAYKAVYLCRLLTQTYDVHVVMTKSAQAFIGKASFQALTHNKVWDDLWDEHDPKHMPHIELSRQAVAIVVAPASAHCIAKLANGLADDLLSTLLLAAPLSCPVFIAPAMNVEMWHHPSTQRNIATLQTDKINILWPVVGEQACGEYGLGKLMAPEDIYASVFYHLHPKPLMGKTVVINAGPTREYLDSVRYLSNASSGLMGFMLAQHAALLGADTTLITGVTHLTTPFAVKRVDVVSALEMHQACAQAAHGCDVFIANAAVADWAIDQAQASNVADAESHLASNPNAINPLPECMQQTAPVTPVEPVQRFSKIKKSDFISHLVHAKWMQNPDIIGEIAGQFKDNHINTINDAQANAPQTTKPYFVAFAAQADDLLGYAYQKMLVKNVDMMVANHVQFINDAHNQASVLYYGTPASSAPEAVKFVEACAVASESKSDHHNHPQIMLHHLKKMPKAELAQALWQIILTKII